MNRVELDADHVRGDIRFEVVTSDELIKKVSELAEEIWHEHYEPIIGKEQVDYMIDRFQSETAISNQLRNDGYVYYLLKNPSGYCGYLAFHIEGNALFLSKLYIAKHSRGRGYARKALELLEEICKKSKLTKIWLTVNRNNVASIRSYESLGFLKIRTQVADIGEGYVMDDYIMEKNVIGE